MPRNALVAHLVALLGACLSPTLAEAAFDPAAMRTDAAFGALDDTGAVDVLASDLDNDGPMELVVVTRQAVAVFEHDPATQWRMRWHHETSDPATPFTAAAGADLDADGTRELVILLGRVAHLHDPLTGALIRSATMPGGGGSVFADVEPPVGDEIIGFASFPSRLEVSGLDRGVIWTLPVASTSYIAVGQADGDPALEIVVGSDPAILVDAGTRSVQWTFPERLTWPVVADLDGDGIGEILSSDSSGTVAWDAVAEAVRWRGPEAGGTVVVLDADGDGDQDVVGGNMALDGASGTVISMVVAGYPFDAGDFDGNCRPDIAFVSSSGAFAVKPLGDPDPALSVAFQLEPPGGVAFGDADADGATDLLRVAYETIGAVTADWLHLEDLRSRSETRAPLRLPGSPDPYELTHLQLVQIDGDPQLEILSASWTALHAVDSITGAEQWSLTLGGSERVTSLGLGAGPGGPLVGVGLSAMGSSSIGTQVRLVDPITGLETWRSQPLISRAEVRDVQVADLDGNGAPEVALVLDAEGTRILVPPAIVPAWSSSEPATSLAIGDLDGDGNLEMLTGTRDGRVLVRNAATRALIRTLSVAASTTRVRALRVADADGDGVMELLLAKGDGFGSSGRTRLAIVRPSDGVTLWESEWTWGAGGESSGIVVGDVDDDGATEIALTTRTTVRVFEHARPATDTTPPAFAAGSLATTPVTCCPGMNLAWPPASDAASAPVTYEIHRSTDPVFVPSPATLVVSRTGFAWRDVNRADGTEMTWAVIPVDRAGNHGAELRATATVPPPLAPPSAPTAVVATDADPCASSGVTVTFVHDGLPPGVVYDLLVDGSVVTRGITSPCTRWSSNGPHVYAVRARHPECGAGPASAGSVAEDAEIDGSEPWITGITELDACLPTGLSIEFIHPGFAGTGHYELLEDDGTLLATPITSPWTHVPPDDAQRDYVVRAVEDGCVSGWDASSETAGDLRGEPDPPYVAGLTDTDPCTRGPVRISYYAVRPPGCHFDIWKDGAPWVSGIPPGSVQLTPEDGLPHDYVLRLVDAACGGAFADSPSFSWTDVVTPCPAPRLVPMSGEPVSVVADPVRPLFYVATDARELVAIDVATDAVVAALPLAGAPGEMVVEPDGSRLYVAVPSARSIQVVDLAAFSVVDQVLAGGTQPCPGGLALNGDRIYASCDDGLSIIDTSTMDEAAFHPLTYGVYAESRLALSADGTTIFALQRSWSPSSLYAHDVRGDGFVAKGEECCHGCVSDGSLLISRLTGRLLVGSKIMSAEALFHDEGEYPVGPASGPAAQSADGSLLAFVSSNALVLVDAATMLPWRRHGLQGYPTGLALSADAGTAAMLLRTAVELVTLTGLPPNVGGVRVTTRDAWSGIAFRPYLYLQQAPSSSGVKTLDMEDGTVAIAVVAPGDDVLEIGTSIFNRQTMPITITAGAWTDLGDRPTSLTGGPAMSTNPICASPPLRRGLRQTALVHVRNVRPGCTVSFGDPGIVVHATAFRTWSVLEVDLTAAADLRLGLHGDLRVTDTGGSIASGEYWVEDAPASSDTTPPEAVQLLVMSKLPRAIELSWGPVTTDVLGGPETVPRYEVLRSSWPGAFGAPWATTPGPVLTWTDPPPEVGLWCFLVRAVDMAGNVGSEH